MNHRLFLLVFLFSCFGFCQNETIELKPSKQKKIRPSISFNGGILKKFDVKGDNGYSSTYKLEENTFESLYRFDFMIGSLINL